MGFKSRDTMIPYCSIINYTNILIIPAPIVNTLIPTDFNY